MKANAWAGETVACLASGPSLTAEDCNTVRHLKRIVTNTTFRLARDAEALYAMDQRWWKEHHEEVACTFHGERFCWSKLGAKYGATVTEGLFNCVGFGNSGANAISLAIYAGASTVILLGFDCRRTNGMSHWHGDHPKSLSNAQSIAMWPEKFKRVADHAKRQGVRIVNCSRSTALKCFERAELASTLESA
jgi:uncharacterized protein (DUF2461 family)